VIAGFPGFCIKSLMLFEQIETLPRADQSFVLPFLKFMASFPGFSEVSHALRGAPGDGCTFVRWKIVRTAQESRPHRCLFTIFEVE
jgi:hypothetical protein